MQSRIFLSWYMGVKDRYLRFFYIPMTLFYPYKCGFSQILGSCDDSTSYLPEDGDYAVLRMVLVPHLPKKMDLYDFHPGN